jgi:hypothetical protein
MVKKVPKVFFPIGYHHAKNMATQVQGTQLVSVIDPMTGRVEQVIC